MATSSGLFLATIYNQSQLAEKHVARYWSINTEATAVPLRAHPSPLVITTKLAAAILGGPLFGRSVLPAQYCPCAPCRIRMGGPLYSQQRKTRKNSLFKYLLQSLPSLVYSIAGLWWGCIVGLTVMNITLTLFVLRLNWRKEADKVGRFFP